MFSGWSHYTYETILGPIVIQEDGIGITRVEWEELGKQKNGICQETELIKNAHRQLLEYFVGQRKEFRVPLRLRGTSFQQKVWKVLRSIPYGEIWTYGQVAKALGDENAARAVGMANNRNPVAIIIPCHRVVGSNGKITGYAGGIEKKQLLLELEKAL